MNTVKKYIKKYEKYIISLAILSFILTFVSLSAPTIESVEGSEQCYWLPSSGYVLTNGERTCANDEYIAGFQGKDAGEHYGTYDWKIKCCKIIGFEGSDISRWTTSWIYKGNETGKLNEYMTGFRGRDGGDAVQFNVRFNQLDNAQKTSCYWTDLSYGSVRECANDEFVSGFKGIGMYEGHHRGTYGWKLQCCEYELQVIECSNNSDCGQDSFIGLPSCSSNDIFQLFRNFTCNNPGTVQSSCSHNDSLTFKQDCGEDYCGSWGGNLCFDGDVYHSRTCHDRGCSLGSCFDNSSLVREKVEECEFGCSAGECQTIKCYQDSDCVVTQQVWCSDSQACRKVPKCLNPGTVNSACSSIDQCVECEFGCLNGQCIVPECTSDVQCGHESLVDNYCVENNVYSNYSVPACLDGECVVNYEQVLNETCEFGCGNGVCLGQCTIDSDCGNEILVNNFCNGANVMSNYSVPVCGSRICSVRYDVRLNQTCPVSCSQGQCINQTIVCSRNEECGIDGFTGNPFCSNNNVYRNFINFACNNAGTNLSYCTNSTSSRLFEECDDDCLGGECEEEEHEHKIFIGGNLSELEMPVLIKIKRGTAEGNLSLESEKAAGSGSNLSWLLWLLLIMSITLLIILVIVIIARR